MTTPLSPASARVDKIRLMHEAAERDEAAGATLIDLERRQDDVLSQLDELDQKLTSLLRGLGVTFVEEEAETATIRLANVGDDEDREAVSSAEDIASDEMTTDSEGIETKLAKRRRAA